MAAEILLIEVSVLCDMNWLVLYLYVILSACFDSLCEACAVLYARWCCCGICTLAAATACLLFFRDCHNLLATACVKHPHCHNLLATACVKHPHVLVLYAVAASGMTASPVRLLLQQHGCCCFL
jgi:hypothetical protein